MLVLLQPGKGAGRCRCPGRVQQDAGGTFTEQERQAAQNHETGWNLLLLLS